MVESCGIVIAPRFGIAESKRYAYDKSYNMVSNFDARDPCTPICIHSKYVFCKEDQVILRVSLPAFTNLSSCCDGYQEQSRKKMVEQTCMSTPTVVEYYYYLIIMNTKGLVTCCVGMLSLNESLERDSDAMRSLTAHVYSPF